MKLIGMLDSPYVRRTAISLELLGVPFEHQSLSVFTTFAQFQQLNPVVKAPSLVCDNGEVMMDSSLIIQFAEAALSHGKSLWAKDAQLLQQQMRAVSLALAACDKGVQWVYEKNLRPQDAQYAPWLERVEGQIKAAFEGLETQLEKYPQLLSEPASQACISAAIAWGFAQELCAPLVASYDCPVLENLAQAMEQTEAFTKYPSAGPGVPSV